MTYDNALKTGCRNRKSVAEMMEYTQLKECLDDTLEALGNEAKAAQATTDTAAASAAGDPAGRQDEASTTTATSTTSPELAGLSDDKAQYWEAFAARTVKAHAKLVAEPSTETALAKILEDTTAGQTRAGGVMDTVLIMFDPKQSGESITAPHLRTAPLRDAQLQKLVGAALAARKGLQPSATTLIDGDLYVVLDGGKHGPPQLHARGQPAKTAKGTSIRPGSLAPSQRLQGSSFESPSCEVEPFVSHRAMLDRGRLQLAVQLRHEITCWVVLGVEPRDSPEPGKLNAVPIRACIHSSETNRRNAL